MYAMTSLTCILLTTLLSMSSTFAFNGAASTLHRNLCLSKTTNQCFKASTTSQESDDPTVKTKKIKIASKSKASKKSVKETKMIKEVKEVVKVQVKVDKPKEVVLRKPDFIDRLTVKTGMTKAESETALSAVLEIITEVRYLNS